MVVAAGLLVLIGLGLFVGGLVTDSAALYWGCVAACALAALLLVLARLAMGRIGPAPEDARPAPPPDDWLPAARPGTHARPDDQDRAAEDRPATGERALVAAPEPDLERVPAEDPLPDGGPERESPGAPATAEPGEEDVEFADLLLVLDLTDDVLVVDEHPRYHRDGCPSLAGRAAVPLPVGEARADGFSPCGACRPVRQLADTERSRRRGAHLD